MGFDSHYLAHTRNDKTPSRTRRAYRNFAKHGIRVFPCAVGHGMGFDWQNGERLIRKVSFSDPKFLEQQLKGLSQLAAIAGDYGAYGFNLADEPSLGAWETKNQFDWSPPSLANFKKLMKKKYGTIENLNKEWETEYKSFDEIEPAVESEIKNKTNLAPWQDFRDHMNNEVANAYKVFRQGLTSADKGVLVGVCGVSDGHPYSGFDWWKLAGICDTVNTYTSCAMLRSMTPGGIFSKYEGYRWGPNNLQDNAWRGFFEGHRGYSYWIADIFMKPDFTLNEKHAAPVREILKTFKNGIGKLWMELDRHDCDIAVHYSQPSIHTNWMMKYWQKEVSDGLGFYRQNRKDWEQAAYDSSLDIHYLAYGQIENGKLNDKPPKVLILPLSVSISSQEVAEIKKYVENGGILIGDICSALRDEHGKPYSSAALDKVFGIQREPGYKDTIKSKNGKITGQAGEISLFVEQGIKPTTGKAQALFITKDRPSGYPIVIINKLGKGKAVYMGFAGQYANGRHLKPQLNNLYRQIFENIVGLQGKFKILSQKGRLPGQTMHYTYGDSDYFGFYFDLPYSLELGKVTNDATSADIEKGKQEAVMLLEQKKHIYDLLNGKYIGETDCFRFTAVPGRGTLYSALPYKVEKISLTVPSQVKPGELINIKADLEKTGKGQGMHVYHLELFCPDGKELREYRKNYRAANGAFSTQIQLPLNTPKGKYILKLTDAATGLTASRGLVVK